MKPTLQRTALPPAESEQASERTPAPTGEAVGWRLYVALAKQAGAAWVDHRAPTMGAALAFYSAFSLAPLLIIVLAVAGAVFGFDAARDALIGQLSDLVGAPAAEAILALLEGAQRTTTGVFATVAGLVTMLVGATTIVVELQDDLDHIWSAPRRPGSSWLTMLRARILSLGMILGIGFLLLVSLVISGAMTAAGTYVEARVPGLAIVFLELSNLVVSIGAVTVLFAMLYKWLPNVPIGWKDVWVGAFITAVLFSAGRVAIGFYLGRSATASAYGAAGTLVVLLLWLYYSAQAFLLGAEFTCAYARYRTRVATTGARAADSDGERR
jgi:membrane protein